MKNQQHAQIDRSQISTLHDLFKARVDSTPFNTAYTTYDPSTNTRINHQWIEIYRQFVIYRNALAAEQLSSGDRILITLPHGIHWVALEQAALYLGLVVVALPSSDSAANIGHAITHIEPSLVFVESDSLLAAIKFHIQSQPNQPKIVAEKLVSKPPKAIYLKQWAKNGASQTHSIEQMRNPKTAAAIFFTSGTTARPKGVIHSHESILNNIFACSRRVDLSNEDSLLSVTPISHIMERVAGYYVPMVSGSIVSFSQSEGMVLDDLAETGATILVTTPYLLECAFQTLMVKHPRLKGLLEKKLLSEKESSKKLTISNLLWKITQKKLTKSLNGLFLSKLKQIYVGGSALSNQIQSISRLLDIPISQGYGLTEAGGVVSIGQINKDGVGTPLDNMTLTTNENDELIIRTDSMMTGYWNDTNLTESKLINDELHTGDIVTLDHDVLHIKSRKSQKIQLSNGKHILPNPIENQIVKDSLFNNVFLYGDNHEKLTLICQLSEQHWKSFLSKTIGKKNESSEINKTILSIRVNTLIKSLPDQNRIDFIVPTFEAWTHENGLLNAQGSINRKNIEHRYAEELNSIYNDIYVKTH